MTKNKKPSLEQIAALHNQFMTTLKKILTKTDYHNRRMHFFKKWNLWSKIINAFVGIGGVVVVGLDYGTIISLGAAAFAVFLLFITVILDFSKKEETHRWLVSAYTNFEKTIADTNITDWSNFSEEDYKKYKNILFDINETTNNLRKEEFPMFDFLHFLSDALQRKARGEAAPIIFRVKWWQFCLANYSSMPNSLVKLIEKFETEQKQQQQQKKQPNKDNKGNEENPS